MRQEHCTDGYNQYMGDRSSQLEHQNIYCHSSEIFTGWRYQSESSFIFVFWLIALFILVCHHTSLRLDIWRLMLNHVVVSSPTTLLNNTTNTLGATNPKPNSWHIKTKKLWCPLQHCDMYVSQSKLSTLQLHSEAGFDLPPGLPGFDPAWKIHDPAWRTPIKIKPGSPFWPRQ